MGRSTAALVGFLVALLLIAVILRPVTSIPTGNVGVLTLFGKVTGETLGEGIHFLSPLKSVNLMSVRTTELKETASVPSKEGLLISLDTSLLFHLDPSKAASVYQKIVNG